MLLLSYNRTKKKIHFVPPNYSLLLSKMRHFHCLTNECAKFNLIRHCWVGADSTNHKFLIFLPPYTSDWTNDHFHIYLNHLQNYQKLNGKETCDRGMENANWPVPKRWMQIGIINAQIITSKKECSYTGMWNVLMNFCLVINTSPHFAPLNFHISMSLLLLFICTKVPLPSNLFYLTFSLFINEIQNQMLLVANHKTQATGKRQQPTSRPKF